MMGCITCSLWTVGDAKGWKRSLSKTSAHRISCEMADIMSDRIVARAIAARTKPRFIEIPRERGGGRVRGAAISDAWLPDCGGISLEAD